MLVSRRTKFTFNNANSWYAIVIIIISLRLCFQLIFFTLLFKPSLRIFVLQIKSQKQKLISTALHHQGARYILFYLWIIVKYNCKIHWNFSVSNVKQYISILSRRTKFSTARADHWSSVTTHTQELRIVMRRPRAFLSSKQFRITLPP